MKKSKSMIIGALTLDAAIGYRMGAGFPGVVTRTHLSEVNAELIDLTNPPTEYGQGVLIDATSAEIRKTITSDSSNLALYGITVKPFPVQSAQSGGLDYGATMSNSGSVASNFVPSKGVIDVLKRGYIAVQVNPAASASVKKGGTVYLKYSATSGSNIQGRFEGASGSGIITVTNAVWNSSVDASGVAELAFNI